MAGRVAGKIKLQSVDELLGVPEIAGTQEIEIGRIHSFPNHPFKVLDNDKMESFCFESSAHAERVLVCRCARSPARACVHPIPVHVPFPGIQTYPNTDQYRNDNSLAHPEYRYPR